MDIKRLKKVAKIKYFVAFIIYEKIGSLKNTDIREK
jgi:hypothetical protein